MLLGLQDKMENNQKGVYQMAISHSYYMDCLIKTSAHYATRDRTTPRLLLRHMRDITMGASFPVVRPTHGSTREDLTCRIFGRRLRICYGKK